METCLICTSKHIASAEIFAHEALAGYPHHMLKAFGQLDHAEMECRKEWPELSAIIHQQKKYIGDALETGNFSLANDVAWDGLQIMMLAIIGHFDLLEANPHNTKEYDSKKWVEEGLMIRYIHQMIVPETFTDTVFGQYPENGQVKLDDETIAHMRNA